MPTYNPAAQQGATWTRLITWTDANGSPINLTGYTARMMLKRGYKDSAAALSLNNAAGIVLGGSAGTIAITITAAQAALLEGAYVYDLEVVNGAVVTRLMEGVITFTPEVSV